jgi:hypothetical protein
MAPRAYWKGYLKLSLVSCPIALFPATSEEARWWGHSPEGTDFTSRVCLFGGPERPLAPIPAKDRWGPRSIHSPGVPAA